MPAKHVRFSAAIAVHPLSPQQVSPAPWTTPYSSPSPASSSSSSLPTATDSSGPFTPPSLDHDTSPYSSSPLPHCSSSISTHLALPAINGNVAFCSVDLTHPDPAKSAVSRLPFTVLAEPATYPPLPYLIIVHKRLPWQIRIKPSDSKLGHVTIQDVLCGVPEFLKHPASKGEYDLIPNEQAKSDVSNAYMRRCKASRYFETERAAGLKRVDFLQGRTIFNGLTATSKGPEVWELHTTTT